MAETKRAECPVCAKDIPLLKDGTFRAHRWAMSSAGAEPGRCVGSGLTPEQARQQIRGLAATETDAEPAALVPEVVTDPQPGTAVERVSSTPARVESAIEAAAEAALTHPGIPGRDEFLALAAQARILSLSAAAPKLVRDDPHLAFHIALVGRDLGISPSAALELIDVLDTQGGPRLSLSPQLMAGQLRRLGIGSIKPLVRTKDRAVAAAYGPHGELLGESEFDWNDAIMAGLVDDRCAPGEHWRPPSGQGRCTCRQGWRTYPKRMLWWRAAGFAADDYFPEAGLGMYSPEALGAIVDEEGRPVDPSTVPLPDGYTPHGNGHARGSSVEERADGADLWVLQARCFALPDEQKRGLRQAREQNERLRGPAGVIPIYQLPVTAFRVVRSLVQGLESTAERTVDGYERDLATDEVLAHCASVLLAGMIWAPQIAQDDPGAPGDPPASAGAPADTQAPETGSDERDIEAELAKIQAEVDALTLDQVVQVLGQAQVEVTPEDEAVGEDHLRELLQDTIAHHRGLGA